MLNLLYKKKNKDTTKKKCRETKCRIQHRKKEKTETRIKERVNSCWCGDKHITDHWWIDKLYWLLGKEFSLKTRYDSSVWEVRQDDDNIDINIMLYERLEK